MGSRNSENSGSLYSDQFVHLLGNNYGPPPPPPLNIPQFEEIEASLNTVEVMFDPWSPTTRQRIRDNAQLFITGGMARNESGPSQESSSASQDEVTSAKPTTNTTTQESPMAVALDRKPSMCVVFEDDPRGITAAHNCTMKATALIGAHPAYDLVQADLAVSSFDELSVINLRRLFANRGTTFMDLEKQITGKTPQRRKLRVDTIF